MTLALYPVDSSDPLVFNGFRCIVAGYTGRDEAKVQHHIDELAAIGVAPPPQVPMLYRMPDGAATTAERISVPGTTPPARSNPC